MSYKNLDVDSKFAKVFNNLRYIRPFYSAVYESMRRVETERIQTMGVSCNEMLYNKEFIEGLEFEEMMFINLHEIAHVALMHVSRRKNRDSELWNIACDLYVNRLLSEEFDIRPGETSADGIVTFPKQGLYCSSLDLDTDYVEDIYDDLYTQASSNGYFSSKLSDILDGKSFHFTWSGNGPKGAANSIFSIDIIPGSFVIDIQDDDGSDQLSKDNANRRVLQDARTRLEMGNRSIGDHPGLLKFKVDELLKSHLDWRKLLRKYCINATRSDTSFSRPDKRMYYQSAIYPGQAMDGLAELMGVKVCFDSSGSISDKDIAYFYGQVNDILKQFKLKAELIYWDTEIASRGNFSDFKEMMNIRAAGRGGTSPECLFEYFDSKACKVKPIVTLVFTDGYIGGDLARPKWKKKYKDTIWIMTRNYDREFKPEFGQLAIAKFSE